MPHHSPLKISGRITDVFGHRFVIEHTDGARTLADLGPDGVRKFPIKADAQIEAEGEMKPTELKVSRIALRGEKSVEIEHHKKPGHRHDDHQASPSEAKTAVAKAGLEPLGEPRRKPKHFEVLARRGRDLFECHVEFDGHIRKQKPVGPDDEKWLHELKHAA